jgi:hypothetical protein
MTAPDPASAGLLIRLWFEPEAAEPLRARLLSLRADGDPVSWKTAAGEAAVLDALAGWVRAELAELSRAGRQAP